MRSKTAVLALAVAIVALGLVLFPTKTGQNGSTTVEKPEGVYERIMRTKTIRCSYQIWPPFLTKDPNTGKMSGVYVDLIERLGRDLGLTINWAEEVGSATMFEGFKTGRVDLFCMAVTASPERTLVSDFSRPIVYDPLYFYVRANDPRFDNAYEQINNESVSLLSSDGHFAISIIKEEFAKAKLVTLPNLTSDTDVLMEVATGKADAAICDSVMAQNFIKNNPGKVRQVLGKPVRYPSFNLAFPLGEDKLRAMLNTSLTYYIETGFIDRLMKSYDIDEPKLLRVAPPYEQPK
ncbi:MAG TPA: hypothetical protein DCY07_01580 [Rhodospirillaceae bacterium]|nr:hypothetical protein [Rhodospirillaceae bacterium]